MGPWSCSGILPNQRRGKMYGWSVSAYMRALSLVPLFSARLFVLFTAILLSAHAHVYCASTIFVVLVVCSAHEPSCVILVFFSFSYKALYRHLRWSLAYFILFRRTRFLVFLFLLKTINNVHLRSHTLFSLHVFSFASKRTLHLLTKKKNYDENKHEEINNTKCLLGASQRRY